MAQMPYRTTKITIHVDVKLSFWQALKLRLAGAKYIEGYVQRLLEEHFAQERDD